MFRPSLTVLESRENPNASFIDPFGGTVLPPPTNTVVIPAPAVPPPATPTQNIIIIAIGGVGGVVQATNPFLAIDPHSGLPYVQ